jgi:hypothetical protein
MGEMQENKDFRTQQSLALSQTRSRQIQKIIKEEGNWQIRVKEKDV